MYNYNKQNFFHNSFKQLLALPNSKCRWGKRDLFIIWEYTSTSKFGNKYTLCLNYEKYWDPRVWIVNPNFTTGKFPHTFSNQSNRLCLYHTSEFKWSKEKNIVQTILCWALVWIEFYEFYKELGKWIGPEFDHTGFPKKAADTTSTNNADKKIVPSTPLFLKSSPIRY